MPKLTDTWIGELAEEHGGAVFLVRPGMAVLGEFRRYAAEQQARMARLLQRAATFPMRMPHHTVSPAGLKGELRDAKGGALLLDEAQELDARDIETIAKAPELRRREVAVFALVRNYTPLSVRPISDARWIASTLGLPLFVQQDDGEMVMEADAAAATAIAAPPEILDDLTFINEHRRQLWLPPLDRRIWTDEDIRIEARRMRGNPRERLLAWGAP